MSPNFREMHQRAAKARLQFLVVLQIVLLFVHDAVVLANPRSGSVVAGSATITRSGSSVTVNQTTNRAVINWQGFSIAKGERTTFNLPGSHAAVLNRVVGADPSAIYGTLSSNGRVYLINPNGIVVGPTGRVNTAAFVASTMNVPNSDFMQGGNLNFTGSSKATVENYGTITASNGDVYLIAGRVINNGAIRSPNGTIGLAAGQDVLLVDSSNPKIAVRPTAQSFGGTGIYNGGILEAMQVELVANGGNIYGLAINNAGLIRADGSATVGGRVYLVANGGNILNTGTLIAKKGQDGGDVIAHAGGTEGSAVVLSGTIDVSGEKSGGTVYMKGATIDATDATIYLAGATPGQVIYSLGPHTVNVDPNVSVSSPVHWSGSNQASLIDTDVMKVKVSMAGAVLDGSGVSVSADTPSTTDGDEFVNFKIESADPNNPFLKVVGFNLDELGGGNSKTDSTEVLFTLRVREPDGDFVTNHLVLDGSQFGGNTKIEFSAVNGELIEYILVNSNQGGYSSVVSNGTFTTTTPTPIGTHTPVFDTFKQVDSTVTTATATILIVDKQTTPSGDPTVFGFRLRG